MYMGIIKNVIATASIGDESRNNATCLFIQTKLIFLLLN